MRRVGIFGLTAVIVLLSFGAYAQESGVRELSLKESITIALEKNLDFRMTNQNTRLRQVEYEEAQANNLLQTSIVNLKNAEFAFKQAQNTLEEQRKQLIFQVMDAYFQVLRAQRKVEIEKMSMEEVEENLEIVNNKFSLGDANEIDVMEAENTLSSAKLARMQATDDLTVSRMDFNKVLGLSLEFPCELTDTFSVEPLRVSLEESVQKALQNRYEVKKAKDDAELARIRWELTQNEYTPELKKKQEKIQLDNAGLNLEDTKQEITLEINRLFRDLEEMEANIHIAGTREEIEEKTYCIAQKQYKAGLISTTELLDAQIDLTQAQIDATDAVFDYNLAKRKFLKAVGEELEYHQDELPEKAEG